MARQCTDIDEVLRSINLRLRKLEKSDSEKTEDIGRLNRIVCQKDKEIHKLKLELTSTKSDLADAKTRIKELEDENDEKDDSVGSSGKPEKNCSNSSALHPRRALPHVNFAGRSHCVSRVENQVVDSLDTREALCSLLVRQTES